MKRARPSPGQGQHESINIELDRVAADVVREHPCATTRAYCHFGTALKQIRTLKAILMCDLRTSLVLLSLGDQIIGRVYRAVTDANKQNSFSFHFVHFGALEFDAVNNLARERLLSLEFGDPRRSVMTCAHGHERSHVANLRLAFFRLHTQSPQSIGRFYVLKLGQRFSHRIVLFNLFFPKESKRKKSINFILIYLIQGN